MGQNPGPFVFLFLYNVFVIRTKLLPKFSEVFYPILHFSLGPRSVGSRSTTIDKAYGYLWLLVQDPGTGALNLFLVNDVDGRPYNWYIRSDIPPTVSLSNPVSLYLPNSENITWATFAFTEEGEPLFAIQRDLPGRKKVEVYDRNGNVWLEVVNAKSPFIVPEALINRKVFGSNVYLFYVTSSDTEIRYQGLIDDSDFGVLTSVPVNARNDLFLVDYTYRRDGIELVYSTASRNYMYVHVEAEAYHLDEEASVVSSSFFERIQKAIRNISRMGVFSSLGKYVIGKIYQSDLRDSLSSQGSMIKGVMDKVYKGVIGDNGTVNLSSSINSVTKTFIDQTNDEAVARPSVLSLLSPKAGYITNEEDLNTLGELSWSYLSNYFRSEPLDSIYTYSSSIGEYYRSAYSFNDELLFSLGDLGMDRIMQAFRFYDECIMDSSLGIDYSTQAFRFYDECIMDSSLSMSYKQVA